MSEFLGLLGVKQASFELLMFVCFGNKSENDSVVPQKLVFPFETKILDRVSVKVSTHLFLMLLQ